MIIGIILSKSERWGENMDMLVLPVQNVFLKPAALASLVRNAEF